MSPVPSLKNSVLSGLSRENRQQLENAGLQGILTPSNNSAEVLKKFKIVRMNKNGNYNKSNLKIGNDVSINDEWTGTIVGARSNKTNPKKPAYTLLLANAEYHNVSNVNNGRWHSRTNKFKNQIVEVSIESSSNITEVS